MRIKRTKKNLCKAAVAIPLRFVLILPVGLLGAMLQWTADKCEDFTYFLHEHLPGFEWEPTPEQLKRIANDS